MTTLAAFRSQFQFYKNKSRWVGIERESFLSNGNKQIAPISPKILTLLADPLRFGYELSACQIEERIGPSPIEDIESHLRNNDSILRKAEKKYEFQRLFLEVAPSNMPLDIFPDPTGRYKTISEGMPKETLLAACRVAGVHIHVGMPDHDTALSVYNRVISKCNRLVSLGDRSNGKRIQLYKQVTSKWEPKPYYDWNHFYQTALEQGFAEDARKCWSLIRISVHGTIEFRVFGTTESADDILYWVKECHSICDI